MKFYRNFSSLLWKCLLFAILLTGFQFCIIADLPKAEDTQWVQGTNIYEVFVRKYYDSKGNKIGDLQGVASKLENLQKLGIKTIWLLPVFNSPSEHGYNVTDFKAINPKYGTMEDLHALVKKAHKLGMKVLLDLPINHCSCRNPLFCSPDDTIRKDNWFIWAPRDLGWPKPWTTPPDNKTFYRHTTWFRDVAIYDGEGKLKKSRGYFYAVFSSDKPTINRYPDFNYNDYGSKDTNKDADEKNVSDTELKAKLADTKYPCGQIIDYFTGVMKFWIDSCEVDGFRCDAVGYLEENGRNLPVRKATTGENETLQQRVEDAALQKDQRQTHLIWKILRERLSKIKPDAILLAEANSDFNEMLVKYYGNADEFNSAFHFSLRGELINTIKNEYRAPGLIGNLYGVEHNLPSYKIKDPQQSNQDAIFLSNHDGFAGDRVATQLKGNIAKIKAVASLYLLLSGIPVIYYGEELGSQNVAVSKQDNPDNVIRGWYDWENYEEQIRDPNSVLTHYMKLLNLRNYYKVLSFGISDFIPTAFSPVQDEVYSWDKSGSYSLNKEKTNAVPVLSLIRIYGKEKALVVHNFSSAKSYYLKIDLSNKGFAVADGIKLIPIMGDFEGKKYENMVTKENRNSLSLGLFKPLTTKVFYLGNPGNGYKTYDNILEGK